MDDSDRKSGLAIPRDFRSPILFVQLTTNKVGFKIVANMFTHPVASKNPTYLVEAQATSVTWRLSASMDNNMKREIHKFVFLLFSGKWQNLSQNRLEI